VRTLGRYTASLCRYTQVVTCLTPETDAPVSCLARIGRTFYRCTCCCPVICKCFAHQALCVLRSPLRGPIKPRDVGVPTRTTVWVQQRNLSPTDSGHVDTWQQGHIPLQQGAVRYGGRRGSHHANIVAAVAAAERSMPSCTIVVVVTPAARYGCRQLSCAMTSARV
jgi:hypothetical protein